MHIPALMVLTYIACCVRIATRPWQYFQLNARYFSAEYGIFSKLVLDRAIPERWRLDQRLDTPDYQPANYPVFLKPEWGQNSKGVHRADSLADLTRLRAELADRPERYLLQAAATGTREFEIFGIDSNRHDGMHDVLTVTEAVNDSETYPVNSKFNVETRYVDVTDEFNDDELRVLSGFLSALGDFGISRLSVRADTHADMLAGRLQVIEVNLFVPMPINLLDTRYTWSMRWRFIRRAMMALARATKAIEPVARPRPIFTLMMLYGRKRAREARAHDRRAPRIRRNSVHSPHG